MGIIQALLDMGAVVVLPIIIFILGLIFRLKPKDAFKSGLTIGIGFIGVNLVIGMMVSNLGTATQKMSENFNLNLTTMDVGWPVEAAMSFATPLVVWIFMLAIGINFIMLALNLTNVMNVDLWNFWHFIFTGALVYYSTGSFALAMIAAAIAIVIILKLADWAAPIISKYFGMEGVTFAHFETINWLPIGYGINKLIDMIPVIRDIKIELKEKDNTGSLMSIFGDPTIMSVGVMMVPISLLLAVILPGNTMLPFADIGIIPILLTWAIIPAKGNVFRALISSIIIMSLILLIGSSMAPLLTRVAGEVGFAIPEGVGSVSSVDGGSHVLSYVIWKVFGIFR